MYSDTSPDSVLNQQTPPPYVWTTSRNSTSHLLLPEQTRRIAQDLIAVFQDGFQWKDLPQMISISNRFLFEFPRMNLQEKRASIVQILSDFIDLTDTPGLPDEYSDPIFKAIAPLFVNVLISENTVSYIPILNESAPSSIEEAAQSVLDAFKDGFQWKDLAAVSQFAIQFSERHGDLTAHEKGAIAKQIVDFVIDQTDTPYLIDSISDPIFKQIIHPLIDTYFGI